jgi:hypothetical protein
VMGPMRSGPTARTRCNDHGMSFPFRFQALASVFGLCISWTCNIRIIYPCLESKRPSHDAFQHLPK